MKCKNCSIELINTAGKRSKLFCSSSCRAKWHQKNKRKKEDKSIETQIIKLSDKYGWPFKSLNDLTMFLNRKLTEAPEME